MVLNQHVVHLSSASVNRDLEDSKNLGKSMVSGVFSCQKILLSCVLMCCHLLSKLSIDILHRASAHSLDLKNGLALFFVSGEGTETNEIQSNVERMLKNAPVKRPNGDGEIHALSGLMYCKDCGTKMHIRTIHKNKKVQHVTYCSEYAICSSANRSLF